MHTQHAHMRVVSFNSLVQAILLHPTLCPLVQLSSDVSSFEVSFC